MMCLTTLSFPLVPWLACLPGTSRYFRVDFLGEVGGGTPVVALSSLSPPRAWQVTATALAVLWLGRDVCASQALRDLPQPASSS
jgi:hypothetical protein